MGFVLRTLLVVGAIYWLSPVDTGRPPDLAGAAQSALRAGADALPAATGSLGRDAAAAALAACAAKPQACADMAATLRGTRDPAAAPPPPRPAR